MNRFEAQDSNEDFAAIEKYGNDGSIALEEFGRGYKPHEFESTGAQVDSWRYAYGKRALDLLFSFSNGGSSLPSRRASSPLQFLQVPGPPLYREERVGRFGRPFKIWKFRSMRPSGSKSCAQMDGDHLSYRMCKDGRDPRITVVGRFLRRWSLDELPQIINVLRGEMSLIGPRPIVAGETGHYERLLPYYLAVTPGLSGLWQVSGRSNIDYPKRAELDAAYVAQWSLRLDLQVLIQTLPAVLKRTGAR